MKPLTRRRSLLYLSGFGLVLILVIFVSPGVGGSGGGFGLLEAWSTLMKGPAARTAKERLVFQIAFGLRMPSTELAILSGVTLALCGAVFQTLFRNPLATPYTLGIASGGSLGALIAIKLGWEISLFGISSLSLAAFAGALTVLAVVVIFSRSARGLTTNELLLAGVTMGMFCAAMMMLVTFLSDRRQTFEIIRWMMGSLVTVGDFKGASVLPLLIPSWLVLMASSRSMNQYRLGEEIAASRGVRVGRLQLVCVLAASLSTAAVVAVCGPIGFVGLVVPHIAALIVGRDCRILFPASALIGGIFLAVCGWISNLAMPWIGHLTGRELGSMILPVGVVTAVIGVPIFLILLHRRTA